MFRKKHTATGTIQSINLIDNVASDIELCITSDDQPYLIKSSNEHYYLAELSKSGDEVCFLWINKKGKRYIVGDINNKQLNPAEISKRRFDQTIDGVDALGIDGTIERIASIRDNDTSFYLEYAFKLVGDRTIYTIQEEFNLHTSMNVNALCLSLTKAGDRVQFTTSEAPKEFVREVNPKTFANITMYKQENNEDKNQPTC